MPPALPVFILARCFRRQGNRKRLFGFGDRLIKVLAPFRHLGIQGFPQQFQFLAEAVRRVDIILFELETEVGITGGGEERQVGSFYLFA